MDTAARCRVGAYLPGKPAQNDYIDRFNRTFRGEVQEEHPCRRD